MNGAGSLRARLMVLILAPLIVIACILGYWRYTAALATAEELFDRSLLAATLAISRDVTVSGGDALSITTRDLIAKAAGGEVFYHVSGPDRAYVTGYAYPPVPTADLDNEENTPAYYGSSYRGASVRALRLLEAAEIGSFRGLSTVTVWQRRSDRQGFARQQAIRSATLLGGLLAALALLIWFGVNRGLRPLLDLENAIAARTSDDLSPIRRSVPGEVRGIVSRLNTLFAQVNDAMSARDVFISNAAHQLRNPVAGMLALAEAADGAASEHERTARVAELKQAAERTARLTTQMLALERIKGGVISDFEDLDLNALANEVALRNADRVLARELQFDFCPLEGRASTRANRVMLEEALENLIDNALVHGGEDMTWIEVSVERASGFWILSVHDDGRGLPSEDAPTVLERFGQIHPSTGSGLGLAIIDEIAAMHGGKISFGASERGAKVGLLVPR